jgi:hypothetical protein
MRHHSPALDAAAALTTVALAVTACGHLTATTAASSAPDAAGISSVGFQAAPVRIHGAHPGGTYTAPVIVKAAGRGSVTMTAHLAHPGDQISLHGDRRMPDGWATMDTTTVHGGNEATMLITVHVPADAEPGRYASDIFGAPSAGNSSGGGVTASLLGGTATRIIVTVTAGGA